MSLKDKTRLFCDRFVANGGNGTAAASEMGYKASVAARMGNYFYNQPAALEHIAANIRRRVPGYDETLRRMMSPGRPAKSRSTLAALLTGFCPDGEPHYFWLGAEADAR